MLDSMLWSYLVTESNLKHSIETETHRQRCVGWGETETETDRDR